MVVSNGRGATYKGEALTREYGNNHLNIVVHSDKNVKSRLTAQQAAIMEKVMLESCPSSLTGTFTVTRWCAITQEMHAVNQPAE